MKRSNRHSQGFSLPEVLIASSLLFTFATLSVGSYRDHVQHEQIKPAALPRKLGWRMSAASRSSSTPTASCR